MAAKTKITDQTTRNKLALAKNGEILQNCLNFSKNHRKMVSWMNAWVDLRSSIRCIEIGIKKQKNNKQTQTQWTTNNPLKKEWPTKMGDNCFTIYWEVSCCFDMRSETMSEKCNVHIKRLF